MKLSAEARTLPLFDEAALPKVEPPPDAASMRGAARFSDCGRYRYALERWWGDETDPLVMCLLNPSKAGADPSQSDPTVTRQIQRARLAKAGGLVVLNAFALVSTDPRGLREALGAGVDPVGSENDAAILEWARRSKRGVVCGWGRHARLGGRGEAVTRMLLEAGVQLWALAENDDGSPVHPLYVPYAAPLRPYPSR